MQLLLESLRQTVTQCENDFNTVTHELNSLREGNINISSRGGHPVVYNASTAEKEGKRCRRRITVRDEARIDRMIRKEYLKSLVRIRGAELEIMKAAVKKLSTLKDEEQLMGEVVRRFGALGTQRVENACLAPAGDPLSIDSLAEPWDAQPFEQSGYRPEGKRMRTSRGLYVRSKSELLIAELLYRCGIPFRYEQVLHVGSAAVVPDFTIRRHDGKIFYWEHMGLISDPAYFDRQLQKLRLYYSAGIRPWRDLIVSFDGDDGTIDVRKAENLIKIDLIAY